MERYTSLLGIVAILCLAWIMSSNKTRIPWRVIVGGLVLQFVFAILIIKTVPGRWVFEMVNVAFGQLLACVNYGSEFVFGDKTVFSHDATIPVFAFKVLPTIIFFSALMSLFYYFGIIQIIVGLLAKGMQKTLGTSGAETLSSAANIFVGQTEAPLVIKPYLPTMTTSELNAVMVGGFATMAGGVLGALADMGINAGHLLAASVISAPGALLLSKIAQPEVDKPVTMGSVKIEVEDTNTNALEAVANGTVGGLQLALNVGAMLIVFIALIALVNLILQQFWSGLSLELILGYLFYPLAWLIGIETGDCRQAGEMLGIKMGANEFVAYTSLSKYSALAADDPNALSDRTKAIMTYALCGFANFSSIGIQLGGIGGMAPERRSDLARLGLRAMILGTLASLMTASIAALFI